VLASSKSCADIANLLHGYQLCATAEGKSPFCSLCLNRLKYSRSLWSKGMPFSLLWAIWISLCRQPSKKVLASSQASRSIALSLAIVSISSVVSPSPLSISVSRLSMVSLTPSQDMSNGLANLFHYRSYIYR